MKMTKLSDDALEKVSGGVELRKGNSVNNNNINNNGQEESRPVDAFCPQCNAMVTFDVYSAGRAYCRPHHHFKQM